eukprot:CAMPEP_0171187102 /NCGR_PEP_ID=MMETSP0790-20130122/17148_1 /TAXON_ID=2925 /ORGANISM="Alexandrium catenella, Strain OF101" /LENGTH=338 /DNA_ID=CAMNT_0011652153 /DNA_START=51 /DNA_END=1066 /DNA_ORIENTATION=+
MSSTTRAATSRTEAPSEKPLVVLTDPHWNFDERTKFDVEKFFEEAKITTGGIEVLQSRFDKFSSVSEDRKCVSFLSFGDFCRMNKYYGICKSNEEEHFFRTMDQQGNGYLCFQDFLLGCAAASPNTPHVLNSYTGLFRARYIFDYYNASRSGTLDYEELACLLSDTRRHLDEAPEVQHTHALEMAQDLGDVSVTTLRVSGLSGAPLRPPGEHAVDGPAGAARVGTGAPGSSGRTGVALRPPPVPRGGGARRLCPDRDGLCQRDACADGLGAVALRTGAVNHRWTGRPRAACPCDLRALLRVADRRAAPRHVEALPDPPADHAFQEERHGWRMSEARCI